MPPKHECIQEGRISTNEANITNICRSMDELRDALEQNTAAVNEQNTKQAVTQTQVNGLKAGEKRMFSFGEKLFFAFLGLGMSVITGVIVAVIVARLVKTGG